MKKADKFVDETIHAFFSREVGLEHVEVREKRLLKRSRVLRFEDVRHEQLHDAQAHGEESHVIAGTEERKIVLGPTLQRSRYERKVA